MPADIPLSGTPSAVPPSSTPLPGPFDRASFILPDAWQTLSDLVGNGEMGLLVLEDGVIVHAGASLCALLDRDEQELLGKPVESLFPQGNTGLALTAPLHGDRLHLLSRSGAPVAFDRIVNHVDTATNARATVWVLLPSGRRLAPDRYSSEAEQAQAILDYLPDPICVCSPDTTLAYASHTMKAALGHADHEDELDEVRLADLAHPNDRAGLLAVLSTLADAEFAASAGPIPMRLQHRDGSWRHLLVHACNLTTHHAVGGLLLAMQDVTEQQALQQSLESEKKRQLHYLNRLFRVAQRPHTDLNQALREVLKATARALCTHRCGYWEIEKEADEETSTASGAARCVLAYDDVRQNFISEPADSPMARDLHALLQRAAENEKPLVIDDAAQDPRFTSLSTGLLAHAIKSALVVPVHDGERTLGLLTLFQYGQAREWRKDECEFGTHVAHLICLVVQQVGRARRTAELQHKAHHDTLTGLPNRRFLIEQAAGLFPATTAGASPMGAFFIDLDGFKHVNDTLGHALGDELLKAASLRLKNIVRKDDILVRLGGDEFMLVARSLSDMRIVDDIARQIVESLGRTFCLQGNELTISASVGTALYPRDGRDIETLMRKADLAMYEAKAAGRNRYRMFASRVEADFTARHVLENELRRAIEERELRHYYQPQIDLVSGEVRCVEALLRWRHPRHGVLLPAHFLPAAEETGLINTITAWAFDDVCQQLRSWERSGLTGFGVAINLSASQLSDPALMPALEQALERTGIPANRIELEISEGTATRHDPAAAVVLDRAARLHVGVSIDDFGTGASDLADLEEYPIGKVKIDGSLVEGLPERQDRRALTDAIIAMAGPLGLDVAAEGVETPEQLRYLREHGCDLAQGYLFSQPLRAEQFEKWLIRH